MSAAPLAAPSSAVPAATSGLLPTSLASRGDNPTRSIDVLLAAACRAACCPCVYGPLWGQRVSRRSKCRIELVVYDCFCMVFLNRPGAYYKVDQWARIARGDVQPARIISSLLVYYGLLVSARGVGALSRGELKAWWTMPATTRRWIDQRVVASGAAPYDYAYVPFLTSFLPQLMSPQTEWRFFDSLLHYVPLFFSDDVELRVVDLLADDSALCYGVFARRPLPAGVVRDVRGQLVRLSSAEEASVRAYGSDHSLLHMARRDTHRINVPDGLRETKRQRLSSSSAATASTSTASTLVCFVVCGGLAFLNNACAAHCNAWPCVWDGDNEVGAAQWQLATLKRTVRAGEELWLDYGEEEEAASTPDCMRCSQRS